MHRQQQRPITTRRPASSRDQFFHLPTVLAENDPFLRRFYSLVLLVLDDHPYPKTGAEYARRTFEIQRNVRGLNLPSSQLRFLRRLTEETGVSLVRRLSDAQRSMSIVLGWSLAGFSHCHAGSGISLLSMVSATGGYPTFFLSLWSSTSPTVRYQFLRSPTTLRKNKCEWTYVVSNGSTRIRSQWYCRWSWQHRLPWTRFPQIPFQWHECWTLRFFTAHRSQTSSHTSLSTTRPKTRTTAKTFIL